MFAKIAKFQAVGPRFAVQSLGAVPHSNDNTVSVRGTATACRAMRPVLACRWRPTRRGGHECHWNIEIAEVATVEPDQPWTIRRICRLIVHGTGGGRLALPAVG
jgi:hypothetical protein